MSICACNEDTQCWWHYASANWPQCPTCKVFHNPDIPHAPEDCARIIEEAAY